jgi:adenine-specific DNA-methyltransferase
MIDLQFRKSRGVYYSPQYLIDFILDRTLPRLLQKRDPGAVSDLKILDPACGSGLFLVAAYKRLLDWHSSLPLSKPLSIAKRLDILSHNIFGIDIDPEAVIQTRLSLLRVALNDPSPPPSLYLTTNIINSNYIIGLNFDFEFDLVIGNPPFGAETGGEQRDISKRFPIRTTDTAALMMMKSYEMTRRGGLNGFIIPKAFAYSSKWEKLRHLLLDDLEEIADLGRAWREVKLEQIIYILNKGSRRRGYLTYRRTGERLVELGRIPKRDCRKFNFIINGIDESELELGRKVAGRGVSLGDLVLNRRGAMLQNRINSNGGGLRVIGGKQIKQFRIEGEKGFIEEATESGRVAIGSILVQNIVAHISHPKGHIKIAGVVADAEISERVVILDTVNQLTNRSELSSHYLIGLLHSRLINWYAYTFIFARAIRTMHFDAPVTDRIPIRLIDLSKPSEKKIYERLIELVEKRSSLQARIESTDEEIDQLVFRLYGLTDKETRLICN